MENNNAQHLVEELYGIGPMHPVLHITTSNSPLRMVNPCPIHSSPSRWILATFIVLPNHQAMLSCGQQNTVQINCFLYLLFYKFQAKFGWT